MTWPDVQDDTEECRPSVVGTGVHQPHDLWEHQDLIRDIG